MRRTLAWVVVAVVLIAGCGGGSDSSDSGGSKSTGDASAGDTQYIDPFQRSSVCLSKREVKQRIARFASQGQDPARTLKAIKAVRDRAC
jgi:hypothetical protein